MSSRTNTKVFRVRNLPDHVDRLEVREILRRHGEGMGDVDIQVCSLASDVYSTSKLRTKTATVTFDRLPASLEPRRFKIDLTIKFSERLVLIVDEHFQGVTPLNDIDLEHKHTHDCIVISGLASHPFGSWQPHGDDKSFMWIRDELPKHLPGVRFLIYGYDTTLSESTSFQGIIDLAVSLINTMKTIGCAEESSSPILFLAHSLGGVILKQALISLVEGHDKYHAILDRIHGALFFGVPSRGMRIPDLIAMIGSQPNKVLLDELSDATETLSDLDKSFGRHFKSRNVSFFWAYETKVTRTVEASSSTGGFARTGEPTVLVSRESATRNLYAEDRSRCLHIDEDHSSMVKFSQGHAQIPIIVDKLRDICKDHVSATQDPWLSDYYPKGSVTTATKSPSQDIMHQADPDIKPVAKSHSWKTLRSPWNHDAIRQALRAPERDQRLEDISERVGSSFDWALRDKKIGLSQWLKGESGIFWIHGKPGSGKSTLLKYLWHNRQTWTDLLRVNSTMRDSELVHASFFFHYRGSNVQKSFEGLLSSILSQILEQQELLTQCIYPVLAERFSAIVKSRFTIDLQHLAERFPDDDITSEAKDMFAEILNSVCKDAGIESSLQDTLFNSTTSGGLNMDDPLGHATSTNTQNLATEISKLSVRYKLRAETDTWKLDELQRALRLLIGQKLTKLSLCIVLDALDEYDGSPDFIASFVRDLMRSSSAEDASSRTRLWILVSSRPWTQFEEAFGSGPGLQIHDHTRGDIEAVCAAQIPQSDFAVKLFRPLVSDIVERAQGVFLWVTLVMRALLAVLTVDHMSQAPFETLQQELWTTLDSLPTELDGFYKSIIERIPNNKRRECYIVMESISRTKKLISLRDVIEIVHTSCSQSYQEAIVAIRDEMRTPQEQNTYVSAITGGLVESVERLDERFEKIMFVQFMHQTVKDFVEDPRFKLLLLAPGLGRFGRENGHTFLAKACLMTQKTRERHPYSLAMWDYEEFAWHAYQAERTTARSIHRFLCSCTRAAFGGQEPYTFPLGQGRSRTWYRVSGHFIPTFVPDDEASSVLELAVACGLHLCVARCFKTDPQCLRRPLRRGSLDFVSLLVKSLDQAAVASTNVAKVARCLILHGMQPRDNTMGLWQLVSCLSDWDVPNDLTWTTRLQEVALALVHGWLPQGGGVNPIQPGRNLEVGAVLKTSLLLISDLVRCGFDPNARSSFRPSTHSTKRNDDTLMDVFTDRAARVGKHGIQLTKFGLSDSRVIFEYLYKLVCLFIQRGGKLQNTSRSKWRKYVSECEKAGLKIDIFEEYGFPLWTSDSLRDSRGRIRILAWLKYHIWRALTEE